MLTFGNSIALKPLSLKVSLVWSSDSAEEHSRRLGDPLRDEAETTGLLGIRWEVAAAWLDRLLSAPKFLVARRRFARFLPKK